MVDLQKTLRTLVRRNEEYRMQVCTVCGAEASGHEQERNEQGLPAHHRRRMQPRACLHITFQQAPV
jgi:hypothetical protein